MRGKARRAGFNVKANAEHVEDCMSNASQNVLYMCFFSHVAFCFSIGVVVCKCWGSGWENLELERKRTWMLLMFTTLPMVNYAQQLERHSQYVSHNTRQKSCTATSRQAKTSCNTLMEHWLSYFCLSEALS